MSNFIVVHKKNFLDKYSFLELKALKKLFVSLICNFLSVIHLQFQLFFLSHVLKQKPTQNMREIFILIVILIVSHSLQHDSPNEEEAQEYLEHLNDVFTEAMNREALARWNYITDITQEHEEAMVS